MAIPQRLFENEFGGVDWVFPFMGMDVGDSFFIPTLKPAGATYTIEMAAKSARAHVRVAPSIQDGYLGVRVWRVR
jgi:hypothetical protein